MCMMCLARDPGLTTYDSHIDTPLQDGDVSGSYVYAPNTHYTADQIADYLAVGFWQDNGQQQRSFDVDAGGTVTVNLNGLDALGKATALEALEAWTAVSGLTFTQSSNAMITFDDTQSGAYNYSYTSGTTITSSHVNVHKSWQGYGEYYLQTFIHEIGHALGLGHGGMYNGSANFNTQAHYANDSWQMSVMSYFSQNENPNVSASFAYLATAQMADILAIQSLYGTPVDAQGGDTIYGDNTNLSQHGMGLDNGKAVTIFDSDGTDTIDLASRGSHQRLDLQAESFSDINGKTGNFAIARGTVIENARTGGGNDHITGNTADNQLEAGAGSDTILGQGGNDVLVGGGGADTLTGGTGGDAFVYSEAGDVGDTITDFDLGQGDRIDLSGLFTALGYGGSDPVGDGMVWLAAASGGAWLTVDGGGLGAIAVAFLEGIAGDASVADIIDVESVPVGPDPDAHNTVITLTNAFVLTWTEAGSIIRDTNGGIDTLDMSAVTYHNRIYLDGSTAGKMGSKALSIEPGSDIENLILGSGRDYAYGNALDNDIDGGAGDDRLYGEAGNDTLTGGDGRDWLYGGEGDDIVTGDEGADKIYGGAGDDTIDAGGDSDKIYGEDGDDAILGGAGRDMIYGGLGNDSMDGGADADRLYGEEGDDVMSAGDGRDMLYGDEGNDVMSGGGDADKLYGGDGDDVMTGGEGKDYLKADDGDDTLDGGDGDDKLYAGDGDDVLTGGEGKDYLKADDGDDVIDAGAGDDKLYGGRGNDDMSGGDGKDYIKADDGDDVIDAGSGDDRVYGGKGADRIDAGDGNDLLYGDHGDDVIDGGAGNDKIYGKYDNDILRGGDGLDYIKGDKGNDYIDGGDANDKLYGDHGIDEIHGGAGNDYIKAGSDDDLVDGGAGIDKIYGDAGDDVIDGGGGDDIIDGGSGDDAITGGAGDDAIKAGTGNDVITGGEGADELRGASGADVFVFTAVEDAGDYIWDFNLRHGDQISVSGLLGGGSVADALAAGQFELVADGRSSMLTFDTGSETVDLAYLRNLSSETVLSEDWLV